MGTVSFWLRFEERNITPYIRVKESPVPPKTNLYGIEKFIYVAETNSYRTCPRERKTTNVPWGESAQPKPYLQGNAKTVSGVLAEIAVHHRPLSADRDPCSRSGATTGTRARRPFPAFAAAQRQRRKVEALFAELKNQIGLRRVRLRRMKHVREQFFLAATAQNLKRLARFLRCQISRISHGADLR